MVTKTKNRPANNSAIDERHLTVNPGDRIAKEPQTIEEKAQQLAVDAPDITGDRIIVPTYFIVDYPNGEKKALHHVRDAKQISDVIRQGQLYEAGIDNEMWKGEQTHAINWVPILVMIACFLMCVPILIGIF